jgi:hypothetical protein
MPSLTENEFAADPVRWARAARRWSRASFVIKLIAFLVLLAYLFISIAVLVKVGIWWGVLMLVVGYPVVRVVGAAVTYPLLALIAGRDGMRIGSTLSEHG